jgi:hypothetical protein
MTSLSSYAAMIWFGVDGTFALPRNTNSSIDTKSYRVVYCSDTDTPAVHMAILSACNHSIITGGTFGWWSAYLAGGQCVWYEGYPRPSSLLERRYMTSKQDYYLPGWIGMW